MRRARVSAAIVVLALGTYGCTPAPVPGIPVSDVAMFVAAQFETLEDPGDACGVATDPIRLPVVVVPLSVEICLNCSNVGWFLREWARSGMHPGLAIVTSYDEVQVACEFLQKERVQLPVIAVDTIEVPTWWPELRFVVLAEITNSRELGRVASSVDAAELFAAWPAPAPQSPPEQRRN